MAEERTLFDVVVSDERVANADRYLVLGLKAASGGEQACSLIHMNGLKDAFVIGNTLGESLRSQFGHDFGEQILLTFIEAAVLALHGQGIPAGGGHD